MQTSDWYWDNKDTEVTNDASVTIEKSPVIFKAVNASLIMITSCALLIVFSKGFLTSIGVYGWFKNKAECESRSHSADFFTKKPELIEIIKKSPQIEKRLPSNYQGLSKTRICEELYKLW